MVTTDILEREAQRNILVSMSERQSCRLYDFHDYFLFGVPLRRAQRQPAW
jgi:hypothetical protein